MNENAKKWVAALRSGEYKQTVGKLQDINGYCCLGVACALYETSTGIRLPRAGLYIHEERNQDLNAFRFVDVRDWIGLNTGNGEFYSEDMTRWLTELNDTGKTFSEIADIIESEPKGLFVE